MFYMSDCYEVDVVVCGFIVQNVVRKKQCFWSMMTIMKIAFD